VCTATEEQVEAAKEVIKKLKFQYSPEAFENPVLQNHWRMIEALALDREEPDELQDFTSKLCLYVRLCSLVKPACTKVLWRKNGYDAPMPALWRGRNLRPV
jgi:hypothetical protein